ncbi:MAG: PAS domain S-box protein, partial [Deltaproteobacteria bacterium]|nr:PAS domain S-box protein [Deltaproteobacteria bacterium]
MSEHTIRDNVDVFRLAFDDSPDVISISRISDGLYRDINQRFSEVLGYARDEVIGKSAEELGIWAYVADRRQLVRSLETQGLVDNLEAWFRAKDGHLVAGLLSGRRVTVDGEALLLTMTRDITAQARTREQVQRAERLSALGVLAGG